MKLTFCALCGCTENLVHHHVVPRSIGGTDDETNRLTVCPPCHGTVHGMTLPANIRELTKAGVARAKAQGRVGGRQPLIAGEMVERACQMLKEGYSVSAVARSMGVSRATVHRATEHVAPPSVLMKRAQQRPRLGLPELSGEKADQAVDLLSSGNPLPAVAQAMGVTQAAVMRAAKRAGEFVPLVAEAAE